MCEFSFSLPCVDKGLGKGYVQDLISLMGIRLHLVFRFLKIAMEVQLILIVNANVPVEIEAILCVGLVVVVVIY